MPTGECLKMDDGWRQIARKAVLCKVIYDVTCSAKPSLGRSLLANPPDNWGGRKGGYDLNGAKKLVFWAKENMVGNRSLSLKWAV